MTLFLFFLIWGKIWATVLLRPLKQFQDEQTCPSMSERSWELFITEQLSALIHAINLCLPGFKPATFQMIAVLSDLSDCSQDQSKLQMKSAKFPHEKRVSKLNCFTVRAKHNLKWLQCVCLCVLGDYRRKKCVSSRKRERSRLCAVWLDIL